MHKGSDPYSDSYSDTPAKIFLCLGFLALICSIYMVWEFGITMSVAHGAVLAFVTLCCAYLPTFINRIKATGDLHKAHKYQAIFAVFIFAEFFSHVGYTVGLRTDSTDQSSFHNDVKLVAAQSEVEKKKTDVKMWEARLVELKAELTNIKSANPWTPTTTAHGLEAEIASAKLERDNEAARGGCKQKCEPLTRKLAALEKQLGTIKQSNKVSDDIASLESQIAGSTKVIEAANTKVIETGIQSNRIVSQTKFVSQLATRSLEPGKAAMTWVQIAIAFLVAFIGTAVAPVCFSLAYNDIDGRNPNRRPAAANNNSTVSLFSAPAPQSHTSHLTVNDNGGDLVRQITSLCQDHARKARGAA